MKHKIVSRMLGALLLPGLAIAAGAASPAAPGTNAPAISTRSYWRYFYTFGPPRYLSHDNKLVATEARYASLNGGGSGNQLTTEPPPAQWADAGFDDARWCVQRAPLPFQPEVDTDGSGPYSLDCIRRVCARTRFVVRNPAELKKLTLEVKYYGGLIVYLNGREVARGHIPGADPLAGECYAEPYPPDAYRPVTPEQKNWGMVNSGGFWNPASYWVPWYYGVKPEQKEANDRFLDGLGNIRRRRISVNLERALLKPGINVLAIENRCSPMVEIPWGRNNETFVVPAPSGGYSPKMAHIGIHDIGVLAEPAGAVVAPDRPAGVQAWAEDPQRWLLEEDYLEPGVPEQRVIRLVGAPGGTFSGQAVVGTASELANPSAALTPLTGPDGAKLPATAVSIRWARTIPVEQIKRVNPGAFRTYMQDLFLFRYRAGGVNVHFSSGKESGWAGDTMRLFDQLSPDPPAKIAARSTQPVWVTVELPRTAKRGVYTGELRIKAGGMSDVTFPVRLAIIGASLPEPARYQSYVGVDESPWALAKGARVTPWSEEHWRLIEQSIRAAGRLGARVAGIPVIHDTELNNEKDAMIKWVKKNDGSYDFDFTLADRYLALWRKYGHGQSDVIVYLVHTANEYGKGGGTGAVTLIDPVTKQASAFVPPKSDTPEGQKLWVACAQAIRARLNSQGFPDANIHWGLFYDYIGPSSFALAEPLAKAMPTVGWARSSHEGRKIHGSAEMGGGNAVRVSWSAAVRHFGSPPFTLPRIKGGPHYAYDASAYQVKGCEGLTHPDQTLLLPRADSDVSALGLYSPLFQLRSTQEMAMTGKYRGAARICIDGWERGGYFGPFTPYLLYPGKPGTLDGSAQFEALREGLQETEARISLEAVGQPSPAVKRVLDRRTELAWVLPPRPEGVRIGEYYGGWQERSWDLYAATTGATGSQAPGEAVKTAFFRETGAP